MSSFNKVVLMGNLTRDPEIRYTPDETAVAGLGLAINENFKNKAGEVVEKVCFVDITVWGKSAENCGKYLKKGSGALVEGKLQLDQWETDDGQKRQKLTVRADRVVFTDKKPNAKPEPEEDGIPFGN